MQSMTHVSEHDGALPVEDGMGGPVTEEPPVP
jgi:hypothetical protein